MQEINETINELLVNHSALEVAEGLSTYLENEIKDKVFSIGDPEKVIEFAKLKIGHKHYESFLIIYTNVKNEVLECDIINEGTIDQAIIYPRRIIEKCIFHNASGIIILAMMP